MLFSARKYRSYKDVSRVVLLGIYSMFGAAFATVVPRVRHWGGYSLQWERRRWVYARSFSMRCSFNWTDHYGENDSILLEGNEVFEGNNFKIYLMESMKNWTGMFQISTTVASFDEAPCIQALHIRGGKTSTNGGFIIQANQNTFIVDSCSSSGIIRGAHRQSTHTGEHQAGGGICGQNCTGEILIRNSYSTGKIEGRDAGGITGRRFGVWGGKATITGCFSTGDIFGRFSGGICGCCVGSQGGYINIFQSYSTGKIIGTRSGGICSTRAASSKGFLTFLNVTV